MQCCVNACEREARYKGAQLCQLHYFRRRRTGTTEPRQIAYRAENEKGYQLLNDPDHPLANSNGYVFEHRAVLWRKLNGAVGSCELCGKRLTWKTCAVDHIDNNVRNNAPGNLRPTCVPCNAARGHTPPVTWGHTHKITYQGETKTANEWARDPRVAISNTTIVHRKAAGMSDEEALFAPKATHNGKKKRTRKAGTRPPPQPKYTRSNAIVITIGETTATAAEWSRHPDCRLSQAGIRYRVRTGLSGEAAVFGEDGRKTFAAKRRELEKV